MIQLSKPHLFCWALGVIVIAGCSGGTSQVGLVKGSDGSAGQGGTSSTSGGSAPSDNGGSPLVDSGGSAGTDVLQAGTSSGGSSGSGTAGSGPSGGAAPMGGAPAAGGSGNVAGAAGMIAGAGAGGAAPAGPIKVMVFNYTTSFGHQSRQTAIPLLKTAGAANDVNFDFTYALEAVQPDGPSDADNIIKKLPGTKPVDTSVFSDAGLDKYDVVFFLNTTGDPLSADGAEKEKAYKQALQDFLEKKHRGFVGTHSATDTFHGGQLWQWYIDMIGAWFVNHSPAGTQGTASVKQGVTHPIITQSGFPMPWSRQEEWYTLSRDVTNLQGFTVLLNAHDNAFPDRPSGWVHDMPGGGRVFYTAFGHDVSAFKEPAVMKFLITGIKWAAHRL